ncbi:MAG: ribbon-helix-helix domain-containing protein [Timaviella obliquedivisa GSE-PSE-MK23-08B]|jgi:hypothetical protein|nr:ribbon-helix-helix domain-containing protein [Timaviella obliquedivisa GSE-PSE-MK23-08B]
MSGRISTSVRLPEKDLWFIDATSRALGYKNRGDALFAGYLSFLEEEHGDNAMIRAALKARRAKVQPAQTNAA